MRTSLDLITAPAVEPVTLAELADPSAGFLRLDTSSVEPAPAAPTAALIAPAAAGNVDNGVHRYRVTFVTATGETEGGVVSAAVTVADKAVNGKVAVTAIPLGGAAVSARKLYRTAAGGSTYLLLATLADNVTATYTDNVADASLGVGCPAVNTTQDPLLTVLLAAARQELDGADGWLRRALITQTWELVLDSFPVATWKNPFGGIRLPLPPLQSVTSITYLDAAGTAMVLAASAYVVDAAAQPATIRPVYNTLWPSTRPVANAVTVRFIAGYGAAAGDVPAPIRLWLQQRVATRYEHREQLIAGTMISEVPTIGDAALANFRFLGESD